ncbi:MAG TPA: hypothetical protein VLA72_05630, partial [Anaerolineales bacterium]|nr:hypothetical protein [Anaerolineales bacterium]
VITQIPLTLRLEENKNYKAEGLETNDSDLWFWETILQGNILPLSVSLPTVGDGTATVRYQLWGATHNRQVQNDHDFDLVVNEQRLDTIRWDGNTYYAGQTELPSGRTRLRVPPSWTLWNSTGWNWFIWRPHLP